MRLLRWDDGTRWDDPNAYWGDPGYVLEPGDPGYVPPAPPPAPPPLPYNRKTMSSNATPNNRTILIALAHRIHTGQVSQGAAVGLHHHTAALMDAAIQKVEGDPAAPVGSPENKGSQLLYRDCVDATGDAETALKNLSDGAIKTWLEGYKKVLEGIHGKKANDGWVAAGFPAGSTAIPRGHDARFALLGAARAYLAAHSGYEATLPQATGPALAITAAEALARRTTMETARTLIDTRTAEQAACKAVRDADVEALFQEVSALIGELDDLLAPTDPRWELFGLNIPANPSPPEAVGPITVTAAGPGREAVAWNYAVRAEYYRVFLKRVGTDLTPVNLADPKDLEYLLKDLTPGATIEVQVVPMNAAGPGPGSPVVTKVVGA